MSRKRTPLILVALVLTVRIGLSEPGEAKSPAPLSFRVEYATYLGGSDREQPREIIALPDGSVLIGGQTFSKDLPCTPGVVQPKYAGEPAGSGHPGLVGGDCFLARVGPRGEKFGFVTYFGGSRQERSIYGMALDREGNIVLVGATRSRDLKTTEGAVQRNYGGGKSDTLLAKISPDGKRVLWCTYLGGKKEDWPRGGLALDAEDNVIVVGGVSSPDFAVNPVGIGEPGAGQAMVVKVKADGSMILFAGRFGGSGGEGLMGARVGTGGEIYVAGHAKSNDLPVTIGGAQPAHSAKSDCWFAKLSAGCDEILYCTYLGGDGNEFAEHRPALLADGSMLLTGVTASTDFPTTGEAFQAERKGKNDGFCAKLSPDGKRFTFCTLLGGSGTEFFLMPTVDPEGRIYLVGQTASRDFPVTPGALQKTYAGGRNDAVLAVLSADGSELLYATYLGGSGDDLIRGLALDGKGGVYLAGDTDSTDFPFVGAKAAQSKPAGKGDGIVIRLAVE